jgi:hypothetical protein
MQHGWNGCKARIDMHMAWSRRRIWPWPKRTRRTHLLGQDDGGGLVPPCSGSEQQLDVGRQPRLLCNTRGIGNGWAVGVRWWWVQQRMAAAPLHLPPKAGTRQQGRRLGAAPADRGRTKLCTALCRRPLLPCFAPRGCEARLFFPGTHLERQLVDWSIEKLDEEEFRISLRRVKRVKEGERGGKEKRSKPGQRASHLCWYES